MDFGSQDTALLLLFRSRAKMEGQSLEKTLEQVEQNNNIDYESALNLYSAALGDMHAERVTYTRALQQAYATFERLADRGHAGGLYMTALCDMEGRGCLRDFARSQARIAQLADLPGARAFALDLAYTLECAREKYRKSSPDWTPPPGYL